jgi:hypothetical protein
MRGFVGLLPTIISAVIGLVVGLALLPTVISASNKTDLLGLRFNVSSSGVWESGGTIGTLLDIIPILFVVGMMGIGVAITQITLG